MLLCHTSHEHKQRVDSVFCSVDVICLLFIVSVVKQVLRVKQVTLHNCALEVSASRGPADN